MAASSRSRSPISTAGASSILPVGVRSTPGSRSTSGAEVTAVRMLEQVVERRPVGVRPESVTERPGAEHGVEQTLRATPAGGVELGEQRVGVPSR